MELLLGCGNSRKKKLKVDGVPEDWTDLVTVDIDPDCGADYVWDLDHVPYPGAWGSENRYDEIHAYEILEHLGSQGDERQFFELFYELWMLLKPGGLLIGTTPLWSGMWAWGDPGHKRILNVGTFVFLDKEAWGKQPEDSPMTGYGHLWKGDFRRMYVDEVEETTVFVLRAVK